MVNFGVSNSPSRALYGLQPVRSLVIASPADQELYSRSPLMRNFTLEKLCAMMAGLIHTWAAVESLEPLPEVYVVVISILSILSNGDISLESTLLIGVMI